MVILRLILSCFIQDARKVGYANILQHFFDKNRWRGAQSASTKPRGLSVICPHVAHGVSAQSRAYGTLLGERCGALPDYVRDLRRAKAAPSQAMWGRRGCGLIIKCGDAQ